MILIDTAERARALKAKERFARTASGFGSDGSIDGPSRDRDTPVWPESDRPTGGAAGAAGGGAAEIEFVRPQTIGEEELQLQLAIAMSKEEAEQEDQKRRSDDVRLQLALSQSEQDFKTSAKKPESHLVDLLDISFGASSISSPPHSSDPWGLPSGQPQPQPRSNDMWSSKPVDPWLPPPPSSSAASAFGLSEASGPVAATRTISPSANSSTSIEGWLQNVPPMAGAVPVLPAKPTNNDLDGAWSMKPVNADPWNNKPPQTQQVPDPWNSKSLEKTEPLDPWAPLAKNQQAPGVSNFTNTDRIVILVEVFYFSFQLHLLVKLTVLSADLRQVPIWMNLMSSQIAVGLHSKLHHRLLTTC